MSDASKRQWKRYDADKYPLLRNLNADIRLIGLEASLCPFPQFVSSQRQNMWASNSTQCMIIDGCEGPLIGSGKEREFIDYTFNPSRFEQDATILAIIPKYKPNVGANPIKATPSFTVVYLGSEDDKVHCMEVPTYTKGTDGFGYSMFINYDKLVPDVGVKKGDCIAKSRAIQGSRYALGINANVCFITCKETVEDAFGISESMAKSMESEAYKTLSINIDKDMIPLNLHGDVDNYKFIPDIGERVREDGIICGFRRVNDATVIADMPPESLMHPQFFHDKIYFTSPDAEIVDIEVYENPTRKVKTSQNIFEQIRKYQEGAVAYHQRVMSVYVEECVQKHKEPAPEFNTLVTNAGAMLTSYRERVFGMVRRNVPKFSYKSDPINFIKLIITYKFKNKVTLGNKITDRFGS